VRREVFERDGERCTFVDAAGRRCEARTLLELDHITARALGGTDAADNLRVRCRPHNALAAERDFGREVIERCKGERSECARRSSARPGDNHPRQRGHDDVGATAECDDAAAPLRALRNLGFNDAEARRAIEVVTHRSSEGPAPPLEALLRQALAVLA
jgi:hypothetical protein